MLDGLCGDVTIHRVPANIRKDNESLYEPKLVSIGPYYYHLRKDQLRAMEEHKWRLLKSFLRRNSEVCVETYMKVVQGKEKNARQSYGEYITLGKDEFIEMLLLDGCFILELLFKWLAGDPDVLFTEGWGPATIFCDLLLFENQIPFFILEMLYDIVIRKETENNRDMFLNNLARFLMDEEPSLTSPMTWPMKIHHLLDLYHRFLIIRGLCQEETEHDPTALTHRRKSLNHWITLRQYQQDATRPPRQIPCATELQEAGVKFRKKQSPNNPFDVQFSRGGILEIPQLQINSNKKMLLTNLVALEKHKTWGNKTVTSYVALMDSLINTKEDVALLQQAGVIHNMLSSHQEAAIFFNQLGDSSYLHYTNNNNFAELFTDVQLYYDSNWNRRLACLIHDYFNSPWAVISVIAALILLGLSTLQTFYAVYSYYKPS